MQDLQKSGGHLCLKNALAGLPLRPWALLLPSPPARLLKDFLLRLHPRTRAPARLEGTSVVRHPYKSGSVAMLVWTIAFRHQVRALKNAWTTR